MSYEYWNRTAERFENFEKEFFIKVSARQPERIILGLAADSGAREPHEIKFKRGIFENGGCYLYFDSYQSSVKSELIPLYVGRTAKLRNRMSQHWTNEPNFLSNYQESIFSEDPKFIRDDPDLIHPGYNAAEPTGIIWLAYWPEQDPQERMYLEHELIFKCRPIYNKS